jgi:hypothetical protein
MHSNMFIGVDRLATFRFEFNSFAFHTRYVRLYALNSECVKCSAPCSTCTNQTSCLTCQTNHFLSNDQCVDRCPAGFYSSQEQCLPCSPICATCLGTSRLIRTTSNEHDCCLSLSIVFICRTVGR